VKKIAILGSTGMIGSGITKEFARQGLAVTEFNRSGKSVAISNQSYKFNALTFFKLDDFKIFDGFDYIINLSGVIRHKISQESAAEIENAIKVNSVFPRALDNFAGNVSAKIIQIGTDCVFSGRKGSYLESDSFDPTDYYGYTKVLGEAALKNTMTLRVSVVGVERESTTELLNWVLNHPPKSTVQGYVNHIWNGVTPLHLAKLFSGVINEDLHFNGVQHIVPGDKVSKYQLVKLISSAFNRDDLEIIEKTTSISVDRSLDSQDRTRNADLWGASGYDAPPTIEDMIAEYHRWVSTTLT
jgi:dTDP-4-dehydrorhamnose reductase